MRLIAYFLAIFCFYTSAGFAENFVPLSPEVEPHYRPTQEIEAGFWMKVDNIEAEIKSSPHRIRGEAINTYVNNMVCRLVQEYCDDIRVYIMRQPYFNASMYPNGMMVVWSGLLLRVDNEDQLAAVLGHEIGHYLRRHTIKHYLDAKSKSTFSTFLSFGLAISGVGYVGNIADLMLTASIFAYGRENEHEADKYGVQLIHNAGYNVSEASKIWDNMIAEDKAAKLHDKNSGVVFFATHPPPEDRSERLAEYARQLGSTSANKVSRDTQLSVLIDNYLYEFLRDQILLNHPGRTGYLLSQLEQKQKNLGIVHYFKGEMFKQRKDDGDLRKAEHAYQTALQYKDAPVQTYRELGLLSLKLKKKDQAYLNLNKYLELAGDDAKDREMIKFYLSMEI